MTVESNSNTEPNKPVLDSGMIPVYYDETSQSWKKADEENSDNNWYNYDEKKWANSVTVISSTRSKYLSADKGTEISMDDILTMQVWIPRYKYKIWNYNSSGTKTSEPQEIKIMWESGTKKTGQVVCEDKIQGSGGDGTSETCKLKSTNEVCTDETCNGKTYTHPAFTFGSKEITGFWMSKFELRKNRYKENGEWHYDYAFKPNIGDAYDSFSVSYSFESLLNMSATNNHYGFSTNTDTHMIKNSEWGAVAYLSHSKYGTCTEGTCKEIGINNNTDFITGCGAEPGSSATSDCNEYNTSDGMFASTTQNIYGVYDMSGSMSEYTMGNMVSEDGRTMLVGESGFDTYPDDKYYDKYSYGTGETEFKRSKLGDGIKEILVNDYDQLGWYTDYIEIPRSDCVWFTRGFYLGDEIVAGLFSSESRTGADSEQTSNTRVVMLP